MNARTLVLVGLALCAPITIACNDKDSAQEPPGVTAAATSTEIQVASAGDIPTEADFEDEAEQDIDSSNLEAQLDALEKEIK
ncbi:MAG: hypothetical protein AB7K71_29090 [Polyangiaceae bacterium]